MTEAAAPPRGVPAWLTNLAIVLLIAAALPLSNWLTDLLGQRQYRSLNYPFDITIRIGIEGAAASQYFQQFGGMVKVEDDLPGLGLSVENTVARVKAQFGETAVSKQLIAARV